MKMKLFTKHPSSVGETYFEHCLFALSAGIHLLKGGLACIIHAFFPFLFETTGSLAAKKLLVNVAERQQKSMLRNKQ
jgi:hypothetical protein